MNCESPTVEQVWSAIDIYIGIAYGGQPPSAVRTRLDGLRSTPDDELLDASAFERDAALPCRRKLRLGNRLYPHMKLVIDHSPDGAHYFFRADTHDQHIRPDPNSRDYPAFLQLMEANQKLAQQIEAAWDQNNLPTFKSYLRADLARRRPVPSPGTPGEG